MTDYQYTSLPAATHWKLQKYKELLSCTSEVKVPFWDIVLITSIDDEQKKCYDQQIQLKKERNEIPKSVRYLVFSDPPGPKIGNGGATMHVLEQMQNAVGWEKLQTNRVLLIHAGGYSQRLPNVCVVGKIFMGLPCGSPMFHMLDAMLVMYIDLPSKMNPGVFLASSDIFLLYNGAGEWDMRHPGIIALAHPLDPVVATRHGVFVFEDVDAIRKRYNEDPTCPSTMCEVKMFLHKVSVEKMRANQAIIPEMNKVYADLAYYLDFVTVKKLIQFYAENKPLACEIDAYGDFLQALGSAATPEYCANVANVTVVEDGLVEMRQKVFELMRRTEFTAVIFNEAMFNHMGTAQEYLYHLCRNKVLFNSYQLKVETMVCDVEDQGEASYEPTEPKAKKYKCAKFEHCVIMHSVLHDRSSISIGEDSVVEYCVIEKGVIIGSDCIVSNLHIPANTQIPDGSYLHSLPVLVDGTTYFTTFAFDIMDSMKKAVQVEDQNKLLYCGKNIDQAMKLLRCDPSPSTPLWSSETSLCTLWTAKLFPPFTTRLSSSEYAVNMLNILKAETQPGNSSNVPVKRMSVSEMIKSKSVVDLLKYQSELRSTILQC